LCHLREQSLGVAEQQSLQDSAAGSRFSRGTTLCSAVGRQWLDAAEDIDPTASLIAYAVLLVGGISVIRVITCVRKSTASANPASGTRALQRSRFSAAMWPQYVTSALQPLVRASIRDVHDKRAAVRVQVYCDPPFPTGMKPVSGN
jgi:hypothetical protein